MLRKKMSIIGFIGIIGAFFFACGDNEKVVGKDTRTVVEFKTPVSANIIIGFMQDEKVAGSDFIVTIKYSNYQSRWLVRKDTQYQQMRKLLSSEISRLEFLSKQFSPNKSMELPVYNELTRTLKQIRAEGDVRIINLATIGNIPQSLREYLLVKSVREISLAQEQKSETLGVKQQAITDWTGDAWYMPVAGTTSIWNTGTLQKFWFDGSALNHYNYSIEFGIEMDTVVQPNSAVTCNSGWSSNLPYAYEDTQFSDTRRNCSVGTVKAVELQAWSLYWTWKDFNSFSGNPHFDIQFQSNEWCWWVDDFAECNSNRPWCMCARDNIEWVISYYYNEAPGTEINWYRN